GTLSGDGSLDIERIADPSGAHGAADLALAMTSQTADLLKHTKARAVVVAADCAAPLDRFDGVIKVARPRLALAILTELVSRPVHRSAGIHPSAGAGADAQLAAGTAVGPLAVVGPRTRIGAGTAILAHVTVGADVVIGRDCLLHPGVRVGDRVVIGDRVILQHNVSLGSDGFSYAGPAPGLHTAGQETGDVARI